MSNFNLNVSETLARMSGFRTSSCVLELRLEVKTAVKVIVEVLSWSRVKMEDGAWLELSVGVLGVVTGKKHKSVQMRLMKVEYKICLEIDQEFTPEYLSSEIGSKM